MILIVLFVVALTSAQATPMDREGAMRLTFDLIESSAKDREHLYPVYQNASKDTAAFVDGALDALMAIVSWLQDGESEEAFPFDVATSPCNEDLSS